MSLAPKRVFPQTALKHGEDKAATKRIKSNLTLDVDKINFEKAIELVSHRAYLNYAERLQLTYLPVCMDRSSCIHASTKPVTILEMPQKVMKLLNVEMKASNWSGALEVCILSITPTQYLSDGMLKNIVEIMLNAQEDLSSGYTISQVLDKCKLVLTLHFSTHCPCLNEDIRKVYTNFLTSPMDKKERSRTNRTLFGSENGIVNFCLTRLMYELGQDSADSVLLDKTENTPKELRKTINGVFYQKEQFDIFEMLDRTERINRLMTILHSIIELVQFDLAIWQSILNLKRPFKGQKTLIECILEPNNSSSSDKKIIRERILKIYSYFIHLEYPEEHIKTMTLWLNAVMELFYMKEKSINFNYPSPGRSSKVIIYDFYDIIISDLPPKSIIKILERIKPAYIRHQLSHHHCNILLSSDEKETFQMLIDFLKENKWTKFPRKNDSNLVMLNKLHEKRGKPTELLKNLSAICKHPSIDSSHNNNDIAYPKYCATVDDYEIDLSLITCTLYITLQSYLEAYGIQKIQDTLRLLNKDFTQPGDIDNETSCYIANDVFKTSYTERFKKFKELIETKKEMESGSLPPEVLNIFKNLL